MPRDEMIAGWLVPFPNGFTWLDKILAKDEQTVRALAALGWHWNTGPYTLQRGGNFAPSRYLLDRELRNWISELGIRGIKPTLVYGRGRDKEDCILVIRRHWSKQRNPEMTTMYSVEPHGERDIRFKKGLAILTGMTLEEIVWDCLDFNENQDEKTRAIMERAQLERASAHGNNSLGLFVS
ncbi:hypothetical protein CVT24_009071 [Panaeolus cyanescens]|uniref:Uncharacterized protein n=1 Tax=Panaeolus cyanescens TaxID=181874 RepID=A0A409VAF9_9AGAR|nr:hypothetical protein CVT24_009071 [Panaeolus cyanescens]